MQWIQWIYWIIGYPLDIITLSVSGSTGTFYSSGSAALLDIQRLDPVGPFQWIDWISNGSIGCLFGIHWMDPMDPVDQSISTGYNYMFWVDPMDIQWIHLLHPIDSNGSSGSLLPILFSCPQGYFDFRNWPKRTMLWSKKLSPYVGIMTKFGIIHNLAKY